MLRLLIKDITVVKAPEPKLLRLNIRWQGGRDRNGRASPATEPR